MNEIRCCLNTQEMNRSLRVDAEAFTAVIARNAKCSGKRSRPGKASHVQILEWIPGWDGRGWRAGT